MVAQLAIIASSPKSQGNILYQYAPKMEIFLKNPMDYTAPYLVQNDFKYQYKTFNWLDCWFRPRK